jgi:hypothetical protein
MGGQKKWRMQGIISKQRTAMEDGMSQPLMLRMSSIMMQSM